MPKSVWLNGHLTQMQKEIIVNNRKFTTWIPAQQIAAKVKEAGDAITRDYQGRSPLFISVLTGSFIFTADLLRCINLPLEIAFIRLASYSGTTSTGNVQQIMGLKEDITGRDIIIVEDIIDSGLTMQRLIEQLQEKNPNSIQICSLFIKPANLKVDGLPIAYKCFEIPNEFILGYGLDYDGFGRELPDIYILAE